jgi:hypothetical protein
MGRGLYLPVAPQAFRNWRQPSSAACSGVTCRVRHYFTSVLYRLYALIVLISVPTSTSRNRVLIWRVM